MSFAERMNNSRSKAAVQKQEEMNSEAQRLREISDLNKIQLNNIEEATLILKDSAGYIKIIEALEHPELVEAMTYVEKRFAIKCMNNHFNSSKLMEVVKPTIFHEGKPLNENSKELEVSKFKIIYCHRLRKH